MKPLFQPPKALEEMSREELEQWEDFLEDQETLHALDVWDDLETLRKLLNESQLEAMHFLKKQSRFGKQCPYYLKARIVFERDSRAAILSLLDKIREGIEAETK